MDIVFLRDLRIDTVIGIYGWERRTRQTLIFDLEMSADVARAAASDDIADTLNYKSVAKAIEFSRRREKLSFGHHEAVASQPPDVRQQLLTQAAPKAPGEPPQMSVAELKKAVRERRLEDERERNPLPAGFRIRWANSPRSRY